VLDHQTPSNPKLPWTSLVLLFLTDATFGWLLHDWTSNREIWLAVAFAIVILGAIVAYPSRSVAMIFGHFFKTDTRALILIIFASIMSVILLTWLQFFVDAVVLCAAGLLVSLDLKVRGWSKPISMLLIIGWQLLGLSAGLGFHYLHLHPLIDVPEYFYASYWLHSIEQLLKN
jgi:ABC-type multidrug transport system fused ATPase/permease subunit